VNLPLVSFRCTYTFVADGAVITSDCNAWWRQTRAKVRLRSGGPFAVIPIRRITQNAQQAAKAT
jgi:hypothetical protein